MIKKILFFLEINIYCRIYDFLSLCKERISRSWAFAKHGWLSYDFDSAYLYQIMSFKLKRIEHCLINGHAVHYKRNLNALKKTIEICDRLYEGRYEEKYFEEHDKKWGYINFKIKPYHRANVKTAEDKKQERKESIKIMKRAENDRIRDIKTLAHLLIKYERTWWD